MSGGLVLEKKSQENETPTFGGLSITPALGGDYWTYRVVVGEKQAILGFPKFSTVGIGFAAEEDWNTNLPYDCDTDEIWNHIKHNKGDDSISDEQCIEAIRLIQSAATEDRS